MLLLLPAMLFGTLLEMMGISLVASVCAVMISQGRESAFVALISRLTGLQPGGQMVAALVIFLIFVYLFKMAYLLAENYVLTRFSRDFRHDLSTELLSGLICGPYEYFTQTSAAEVANLIHSGAGQAVRFLDASLRTAAEALILVFIGLFLLLTNPAMTLFAVLGAAASFLLTQGLLKKRAIQAGETLRTANAARIKWMNQGVRGIKEVKTWRAEAFFSDAYSASDLNYSKAERTNAFLSRMPRICIEAVMATFTLLYVLFLSMRGGDVLSFFPSLSAFVLAAMRMMPACSRINANLTNMNYARPAMESVASALRLIRERQPEDQSGGRETALAREITAEGITFAYHGRPEPVLQDARIVLPIGSAVGIVGQSGAGKTTLIDILLGLLHPQQGAVFADGVDITQCRESYLQKIAYVPQTAFLLDGTVRENVAFGAEEEAVRDEAVWEALTRASLADRVRAMPFGLDTRVGEGGIRLSGGERQRLGIARALYRGCPVLIFDESTSALDAQTEAEILDAIYALKGEKTIVVVSHRSSVIERCDIVFRVEDGKISKV